MLKLLLDENISPRIVDELWRLPVDAVHLRNRGMLGASDNEVWRFAVEERRTVVTINECHLRAFARNENGPHGGLIAIPSGGNFNMQHSYIMAAINYANENLMDGFNLGGRYVKVEFDCALSFPTL